MYTNHFSLKNPKTPQNEQAYGAQQNNAGGYSFVVDKWAILDRFLILGTEGGTYYVQERKLTRDNAKNVIECIQEDGVRVVQRIDQIVKEGRACKLDPSLFALGLCMSLGNAETKKAVAEVFCTIVKTGTHLFTFVEYIKELRGWGRSLKRLISSWYNSKDIKNLLYQIEKYKSRKTWSHYDVLNLAHIKPVDEDHKEIYQYLCTKKFPSLGMQRSTPIELARETVPDNIYNTAWLQAVHAMHSDIELNQKVNLIRQFKLPREVVPTDLLNDAAVWKALLDDMPMMAVIRNLNKMTSLGILNDLSDTQINLIKRLEDETWIEKSKIHPLAVLNAYYTYAKGTGVKGDLFWTPQSQIVQALDKLFSKSFKYVQPCKKRIMLAVDVSHSMHINFANNSVLSCAKVAAAIAMIYKNTEPYCIMKAFSDQFVDLQITNNMPFGQLLQMMASMPFGGTDCSLPILWALQTKTPVDAFVVITDNETHNGSMYPSEALRLYRKTMGIDAKMVVVSMTATQFTIADPADMGMLDIVGFDTNMLNLINDFIK